MTQTPTPWKTCRQSETPKECSGKPKGHHCQPETIVAFLIAHNQAGSKSLTYSSLSGLQGMNARKLGTFTVTGDTKFSVNFPFQCLLLIVSTTRAVQLQSTR